MITVHGPISEFSDIWSAAAAPRSSVPTDLLARLHSLLIHVRDHGFFTLRIWGVLIQGLCNLQLRQLELLLKSCEVLYVRPSVDERRRSLGARARAPRTSELAQSLAVNFTQPPIPDDLLFAASGVFPGATQPFGTPTLNRLAAALEAGQSPREAVDDVFALPPVDGDSFIAELRRLSADFTPRHDLLREAAHQEEVGVIGLTPKRPRRSTTLTSPPSSTRRRRTSVATTTLGSLKPRYSISG